MNGNDTSSDYPVNSQTRGLTHNASTGSAQGGANWQTPASHSNPFAALNDTKPAGQDPADPQFNAAQQAADPFEGMSPSDMTQQHIPRGNQHTQASMYSSQGQGQGAADTADSYTMGQNTQSNYAQNPRDTFQASFAQPGQDSAQEHYASKGQGVQEFLQHSGQESQTFQGYDKSGADAAESARAVMGDYASSGKGEQQPSAGSGADTLSSCATQAKQRAQDTASSAADYAGEGAHSTKEASQGSAESAEDTRAALGQQISDTAASTKGSVADAASNAQQTAQDTGNTAQNTAASYYQSAKDTLADYTQQGRQGAQGTAASAQDAAGNDGQQAKQWGQRAAETGQDYLQAAKEMVSDNTQKAKDAAQSTGDAAGHYGQKARGVAQETAEAGQDKEYGQAAQANPGGNAQSAQETAGNYTQEVKEALAGTLESAQETASKYTQQAQGAAQGASKSAQQTATYASQQAQESTQGGTKPVQDEAAGHPERAKQATQEGVESAKNTEPAEEAGKAADNAAGIASDYADAAKEATVGDAAAAVDEENAEAKDGVEGSGGRQGVMGWAMNTATSTVRGVARTAGGAVNTAGGIASRAGQMVGLTKKHEEELPAEKPGVTTSTGLQASRIEDIPGRPQSVQGKVLETAEGAIQNFNPFSRIHQHVCGFHFYAHDITRQVEAHHFCACPNEDVRQCVIYDSDKPNARLIGTEYIISDKLFETLPEEEKVYWHSHKYEVQSGTLQAPSVPVQAEDLEMQKLINTYGKTFHTWQVDRGDVLPFGPPQLMMAFTGDGAADPRMVAKRDAQYGTNSDERKAHREQALDFSHQPSKAADHWMQGNGAYQLQLNKTDFNDGPGSQHREE